MATYERLDYGSDDGAQIGGSASDKIGFYGVVPVVRRPYSSAVHGSGGAVTSASFGATQSATLKEIQDTLKAIGLWASA